MSDELIKREVTSTNCDLCDEDLDEDAAMWERRALAVCTALYSIDFMSRVEPYFNTDASEPINGVGLR